MNTESRKKKRTSLSAFSILYLILFLLAGLSWMIPEVKNATVGMIVMASYKGFADAADVCFFVIVLSGFLSITTKTGALHAGIARLVKTFKGRELILIPILMFVFSIGGTTFGMAEETIAFYVLITATMVSAGFDSMVGFAAVLLGSGVGVIGSTVNPFAVGIAVDSVNKSFSELGIASRVNNGTALLIGSILWISSLLIACIFLMRYAKKVKKNQSVTILSVSEQEIMHKEFAKEMNEEEPAFTGRMHVTLVLVAAAFAVMVMGIIPWKQFNIPVFDGWSAVLTGVPLGEWWFGELAMWFFIMCVIIGILNKMSENTIVTAFIDGTKDVMGVILVIAVARGASVLMGQTGLDRYILIHAAKALEGLPAVIFAPLLYILYSILSFVIPSSSGLATVSMPIIGPLTHHLHYNPAVMVMIFSSASGLLNLFTPTSGVVMGGLALSRIEYRTWLRFVGKLLILLLLSNIVILTAAMIIL